MVAQKTVESPQLQWLGVVQFLDKVVVLVCATTEGAQCLVRLCILAPFYQGGLWKNLYDFLREGVDSDPEVNSRRFSPCSHAEDEVAALVVNNVSGMLFGWYCWISAPRAVFTTLPA